MGSEKDAGLAMSGKAVRARGGLAYPVTARLLVRLRPERGQVAAGA